MPDLTVVTTSDRPDLEGEAGAAFRPGWPEFIFHDPISREADQGRYAETNLWMQHA